MMNDVRPIDGNALAEELRSESLDAGFYRAIYEGAARRAQAAPTLDYAPVVHGEWEERTRMLSWCDDDVDVYFVCSACKEENYGETLFCPCCGAKMDGGNKDG